jgi:hypothetical protein
MVKQDSTRKTSSADLDEWVFFTAETELLLTDLANLHDRGHEKFWGWRGGFRAKLFRRLADTRLTQLRDQLRRIWDPELAFEEKDSILREWLCPGDSPESWTLLPRFKWGRIVPNVKNLQTKIALAALDYSKRLAICRNPDCPAPYFLAKRSTQKYCERGDCTAYAQRQYALDWWKRNKKPRTKLSKRKEK